MILCSWPAHACILHPSRLLFCTSPCSSTDTTVQGASKAPARKSRSCPSLPFPQPSSTISTAGVLQPCLPGRLCHRIVGQGLADARARSRKSLVLLACSPPARLQRRRLPWTPALLVVSRTRATPRAKVPCAPRPAPRIACPACSLDFPTSHFSPSSRLPLPLFSFFFHPPPGRAKKSSVPPSLAHRRTHSAAATKLTVSDH